MKHGLTVGKLREKIRAAEISNEITDELPVYVVRNGVALPAQVATSFLSRLPNGKPICVYGLVIAEEGEPMKNRSFKA